MKKLAVMLLCAGCALAISVRTATAIPPFQKQFLAMYLEGNDNEEFVAAVKKAKCNVCHMGKKKKDRNAYGKELAKLLDKKEHKDDVEAIQAALKKVAAMKAEEGGKTYGELIKEGKLPGGES